MTDLCLGCDATETECVELCGCCTSCDHQPVDDFPDIELEPDDVALPGLEHDEPRRWSKTQTGYLAHMARLDYDCDGYVFWGLAAPDPDLIKHRGQLGVDQVETVWLIHPARPLDVRCALVIIADGTVLAWTDALNPGVGRRQ